MKAYGITKLTAELKSSDNARVLLLFCFGGVH